MTGNIRLNILLSSARPFLTDGGLETTLVFHEGVDLQHFAAFSELQTSQGRGRLDRYYTSYLEVAQQSGAGFVLDTPTWRANAAWGKVMDLDAAAISKINQDAVAAVQKTRQKWETETLPIVISGSVGPAGDGYSADQMLDAATAQVVHATQIQALARAGVDYVSAMTITHTSEAIGVVQAAQDADIPVVISFTVETDGKLPTGQTLGDAIAEVDAATGSTPLFYMINCAHPEHFRDAVDAGEEWLQRIGGIRANASRMSHAELDEAEELDAGDPVELATDYQKLQKMMPHLSVLGGCCGTDHHHVAAIGHACIHSAAH